MDILLLEDDSSIRDVIAVILSSEGYDVACGQNGIEGLSLLAQTTNLPRVILLDLSMPKMNGEQFIQALRTSPLWKEIPAILLTAVGNAKIPHLNVDRIIPKPVHLDAFVEMVGGYFPERAEVVCSRVGLAL